MALKDPGEPSLVHFFSLSDHPEPFVITDAEGDEGIVECLKHSMQEAGAGRHGGSTDRIRGSPTIFIWRCGILRGRNCNFPNRHNQDQVTAARSGHRPEVYKAQVPRHGALPLQSGQG